MMMMMLMLMKTMISKMMLPSVSADAPRSWYQVLYINYCKWLMVRTKKDSCSLHHSGIYYICIPYMLSFQVEESKKGHALKNHRHLSPCVRESISLSDTTGVCSHDWSCAHWYRVCHLGIPNFIKQRESSNTIWTFWHKGLMPHESGITDFSAM